MRDGSSRVSQLFTGENKRREKPISSIKLYRDFLYTRETTEQFPDPAKQKFAAASSGSGAFRGTISTACSSGAPLPAPGASFNPYDGWYPWVDEGLVVWRVASCKDISVECRLTAKNPLFFTLFSPFSTVIWGKRVQNQARFPSRVPLLPVSEWLPTRGGPGVISGGLGNHPNHLFFLLSLSIFRVLFLPHAV